MTSKRSDTELLELRRKVCEALGSYSVVTWDTGQGGMHYRLEYPDGEMGGIRFSQERAWRDAPALESNNGLALDALDKLCAERKLYWDLRRITTRGELDYFACRIGNFKVGPDAAVVTTDTGTPALAIVSAIIAASAKGKEGKSDEAD